MHLKAFSGFSDLVSFPFLWPTCHHGLQPTVSVFLHTPIGDRISPIPAFSFSFHEARDRIDGYPCRFVRSSDSLNFLFKLSLSIFAFWFGSGTSYMVTVILLMGSDFRDLVAILLSWRNA